MAFSRHVSYVARLLFARGRIVNMVGRWRQGKARQGAVAAKDVLKEPNLMDRNSTLGGSLLSVVIRLTLISIAVGIVLKALGIDLRNFFDRINELLRNVYDLGFGAIQWILEPLLLGAIVVIPIWFIGRVFRATRPRSRRSSSIVSLLLTAETDFSSEASPPSSLALVR